MLNLFSKSRKSESKIDLSRLKADMHSHLIPGIDDGSPDMETSLKLIRGMMEFGYTKLITTPHIMWDMYKNDRDTILKKLDELREAVQKAGLKVEIEAGAEYFLDDHVEELIKKKQPMLSFGGNMVLVEFSMAHPSMSLKDILFDLQMQGYQPVIAHPERYSYLKEYKQFYEDLKEDIGCLFQLNLLALTNYYGKSPQELAQYLIKKGYYDLIGSDLHHLRHLESMNNSSILPALKNLLDTGKIRNDQL